MLETLGNDNCLTLYNTNIHHGPKAAHFIEDNLRIPYALYNMGWREKYRLAYHVLRISFGKAFVHKVSLLIIKQKLVIS